MKKGRSFAVDGKGYYHLRHPKKAGQTRCRRSSRRMKRSWDPTAAVDCEACRDLIRLDVKAENSPYKETQCP